MAKSCKNNKKRRGGKTQKLWKMKGCSKTKLRKQAQKGGDCGCGAPFLQAAGRKMQKGVMQKGGNCGGTCGLQPPLQIGGSGLPPLPPTHVGSAWGGNVKSWPGVTGPHDGSWLKQNLYNGGDPQTSGTINERTIQFENSHPDIKLMTGGKKSRKNKKRIYQRGGSLLGNFFQNMKFGAGSAYNTLYGYQLPVDPKPYVQPNMRNLSLSEFVR
jgi:hypothetical protein